LVNTILKLFFLSVLKNFIGLPNAQNAKKLFCFVLKCFLFLI